VTRRPRGAWLVVLLVWLFVYPVLLVVLDSARGPDGWTLEYVSAFLREPGEWAALWGSLWISVASVVLAGAIGVPLAFVFERLDFPGRRVLGALVALPAVLPPLVGVIAFLFLYGESGFVARALTELLGLDEAPWRLRGAGAILLVHAYSMYVYFYLLTALGSFSAPYIFGGGFRVMTTQIVASKLNGDIRMAVVETSALALVALIGLFLLRRQAETRSVVAVGKGIPPAARALSQPIARWGATGLGWAFGIVLLLPHATLVVVSLVPLGTWTTQLLPPTYTLSNYATLITEPERLRPLVNSLWMATVATVGAIAIALWAGRLVVQRRATLRGLIETLVSVPWAIPGTVLAIALATAFSVRAPWMARWVLVGTVVILPLAYLVRNIPIAAGSILAGFRQLDPSLDEAAASLGAGRWRTLRAVTVPLLRPAILAGAALAFATALGDFVTSIVLYTYETRPISIEILSSLRAFDIGTAAAYGVVLMLISAGAMLVGTRR
jgi:iron(III) transport system permease protein